MGKKSSAVRRLAKGGAKAKELTKYDIKIIEECEERLDDGKLEELVNLVVEVLPPPPQRQEAEQEGQ
ncbi:hypothetical protein ACLOJK_036269 [Asimina triloba]